MFYPFFICLMDRLQRSLQYLTFSQVFRHFFRHVNALLHVIQIFSGKFIFFINVKNQEDPK